MPPSLQGLSFGTVERSLPTPGRRSRFSKPPRPNFLSSLPFELFGEICTYLTPGHLLMLSLMSQDLFFRLRGKTPNPSGTMRYCAASSSKRKTSNCWTSAWGKWARLNEDHYFRPEVIFHSTMLTFLDKLDDSATREFRNEYISSRERTKRSEGALLRCLRSNAIGVQRVEEELQKVIVF
ncbi:hypothetical protein JCM10213_008925 [Rhodosporidiobolus nylandii]